MPTLPAALEYGYVDWTAVTAVGDTTGDPDDKPDAVAPTGTITFTPVVSTIVVDGIIPVTVVPQKITCTLNAEGQLVGPSGQLGVALVTGQYKVAFAFTGFSLPGFTIEVTTAHTEEAPLSLALAAPLVPSPATVFVVNQQVYEDTAEARDQAVAAAAAAEAASTLEQYANMAAVDAVAATEIGIVNLADYRAVFGTTVPVGEYGDVLVQSVLNGDLDGDFTTVLQVANITWWEATAERKYVRTRGKYGAAAAWGSWSQWWPVVPAPTVSGANTNDIVPYVSPGATNFSFLELTDTAALATIPKRGTNGRVTVGEPSASSHAATKNYVDTGGWVSVPASATSSGTAGQKARDSSFLYICTATNTWRRVAISSW